MLERFGLENRILAFSGDNASSNDTQAMALDKKKNSFRTENRICCFNHTIQLSAKALLQPFTSCITAMDSGDVADEIQDLMDLYDDEIEEDDESIYSDNGSDIDGLHELNEAEQAEILKETAIVKQTISKVCIALLHTLLNSIGE
jgi:hypothetical protein